MTDGFSAEKATAKMAEIRALQAGDVSYKEQSAASAARARVELDGVSAEKSVAAARVSVFAKYCHELQLERKIARGTRSTPRPMTYIFPSSARARGRPKKRQQMHYLTANAKMYTSSLGLCRGLIYGNKMAFGTKFA